MDDDFQNCSPYRNVYEQYIWVIFDNMSPEKRKALRDKQELRSAIMDIRKMPGHPNEEKYFPKNPT